MKIFRQFRIKNILSKRFTPYLLYAIGEIVLIILGILIALKINTWNEENKLRNEESTLLSNLAAEYEVNLDKLQRIQDINSAMFQSTLQLKELIGKPGDIIRQHNIDSLLYISILIADFQPNQFILSQMKTTDKMQIIRSEILKRLLYDWENELNVKTEAFNMWNTYFMNSLIPFLDEHASVRNMDYYGNYKWSKKTPLQNNTNELFSLLAFDNRLENHMFCLNAFSESINHQMEIAETIRMEIGNSSVKIRE